MPETAKIHLRLDHGQKLAIEQEAYDRGLNLSQLFREMIAAQTGVQNALPMTGRVRHRRPSDAARTRRNPKT